MPTHKERMLAVMRGEMVDVIPFVPRLDLWWLANTSRGTMPEQFTGMTPDEIAKSFGWACYHMIFNSADIRGPEDMLHRAIGLFKMEQGVYEWKFSPDIEVNVQIEGGMNVIEYHTPVGMVRTVGGVTEKSKQAGSNLGWVQEHIIKKPQDYEVVGYIFENIEVLPSYEKAQAFIDRIGEDGVVCFGGVSGCASPMHFIQRDFIDATQFFYEYKDNYNLMRGLADRLEAYYDRVLAVVADSPAEVVLWGANYDDMLTYPPYFEKEIVPWLRKAAEALGAKGKIMATHTDGENLGLMDLIRDCGAQVAESVTPWPMTQVTIGEYHQRWRDRLTIMGGIPECILLEESASEQDFEDWLDNLFKTVAPGDRLILGPADSTPPDAVFERMLRIAERVEKEGRLPLAAGAAVLVQAERLQEAAGPGVALDEKFKGIQDDVISGDAAVLAAHCLELLGQGEKASTILNRGMIPAMQRIGDRFRTGDVFIPEVLLAARAMNEVLGVLEPHLVGDDQEKGHKVLIGTVQGDMHDIGKNMVAIMLRGVGFEVLDLGVNVPRDEFVARAEEFQPDVVGISALLTTTMPEMKGIIDALRVKGLLPGLKVMVGGAPVNHEFADNIGADGYGKDAGEAVQVVKRLVAGQ